MYQKIIFLPDGTELRLCPLEITGKPLYCARNGKFYNPQGRELKYTFSPSHRTPGRGCHNGTRGNMYPCMRHFASAQCHKLIALTWIGPRPEGMEIDHLNGDILNWSADNLEYVTPAENRKRARLLRVLRSIGRDPKQMSREELLNIFEKYEFSKRPADA